MPHRIDTPARSLHEYRLLPSLTAGQAVTSPSLVSRLCRDGDDFIRLQAPLLSAAMQAVTNERIAIAVAQLGGLGILPVSQSVDRQCETVQSVKRFKAGFQTGLVALGPDALIAEVMVTMERTGYRRFPVTDNGLFHGRLVGVITDKDFDPGRDAELRVAQRMSTELRVGIEIDDLAEANRLMVEHHRGFLPIVSEEGTLRSVVFKRDSDLHRAHPDETVDAERRLRVGAAVSTHPEDRPRALALLESEVDLFVIDASDGHTEYAADTVRWLKSHGEMPVVAGNVITAASFDYLAEAGADAIKVGMGIGSGCTTQWVRATGRGQASALMDVAGARDRHLRATGDYLPIIADGGITGAAQLVIALALGADGAMLGNLLARYSEAPGELVTGAKEQQARCVNVRSYGVTFLGRKTCCGQNRAFCRVETGGNRPRLVVLSAHRWHVEWTGAHELHLVGSRRPRAHG